MDLQYLIPQMETTAQTIRSLVSGWSDEEARWRPDEASWSVLEVVNHLLDEEREDFRARVDLILHRPGETWFPIDPEGWVMERGYNRRGLKKSLQDFLTAREESLDWLRSLESPEWDRRFEAPFGRIRAGDVMAAWAAHDLLHTRQLVELKWTCLAHQIEPYDVRYAGEW